MPSLTKKLRELAREIHIIEVRIYKLEVQILNDKTAAMAYVTFEATYSSSKVEQVKIALPVISVWVDQRENNPCKMHCRLMSHDLKVIQFMQYLQSHGSIIYTGSNYTSSRNRMSFQCDRSGTILRYGAVTVPYMYQEEQYATIPAFDSKAIALQAAIKEAASGTTLGGLDLINLAVVGDSFMQQMGFDWVADELSVGIPMWKGDVNKLVGGSASGYGSYNSYSYGNANRQKKKDFLEVLETALAEAAI